MRVASYYHPRCNLDTYETLPILPKRDAAIGSAQNTPTDLSEADFHQPGTNSVHLLTPPTKPSGFTIAQARGCIGRV